MLNRCKCSVGSESPWRGRHGRLICLAAALVIVRGVSAAEQRVIVISPHAESIRYEFGRGFAEWHQRKYGEPATVEWRDLGGSSDAIRFVLSEFANKPGGIGIDCFFGGGPEPYLLFSDKQLIVRYLPPPEILDGIPQEFTGGQIYDASHTWYGAALSSFGILQNTRVQRLAGLPRATKWEDLANPRFYGWVGAGDPRNSGTMNNMFEAFLQAYGWERGWEVLTEVAGNVRKFDRFSATTAKDVTLGETAYGFAIDFYGFSQIAEAGRSNMTFALPQDFTSVSPDGIAILKGAPDLVAAERFIDFVLSDAGQKLWLLPRGHSEGPRRFSIERMPVRPALYKSYQGISNIEYSPFELKQSFRYDPKLARARRELVAALAGAVLVDTHAELQSAWRAVTRRGLRAEEVRRFGAAPLNEADALTLAAGAWKDPATRNQKKLDWQIWAQHKFHQLE